MPRPNVVFIITDQQRPDTLGCLGYGHAVTPNLDRLAARGVCLTNTYVQSTVCVPSRACMLSSKYIHQHGARDNGAWIREDETNWVHDFRRAGYHAAAIGKIHSKPIHHPCGFQYRWVVENKNHPGQDCDDYEKLLRQQGLKRPACHYNETVEDWYGKLGAVVWPLADELFPDNVVGQRTVEYIGFHDFQSPLLLHVGFAGPHDPFDVPQSDLDAYGDRPVPEPVGYEGELEEKPAAHRRYMELMDQKTFAASIALLSEATPERIARMRRHYYANVMTIDRWVGRICDALAEKGQLENTVFVFTSDHGDNLADHGMIYKFETHYEPVVRVPAIVAGPGVPARGPEGGLVETIDFGPTLLDLCGIESEQAFSGQTIRPLLEDGTPVHDVVFSEYGQRLMARDASWKLVYYAADDEGELYHLAEDPDELNNRYGDPSAAEVCARLMAKLLQWRRQ
jgi:arylsulfatase A-like enzyme